MRWTAAAAIAATAVVLVNGLAPLSLATIGLLGVGATAFSVIVSGVRAGSLTAALLWVAMLASSTIAPMAAERVTLVELIGLAGLLALVPASFAMRDRLRPRGEPGMEAAFIEHLPAAAMQADPDGALRSVNGAAASLLARSSGELVGQRLQSLVRLADESGDESELDDLARLRQPTDAVVLRPGGERRDVRAQAIPISAGPQARFAVHLQATQAPPVQPPAGQPPWLLQALLEHAGAAVSVRTADRRYTLVNRAFVARFGLTTPNDLLGRTASEVFDAALAAALDESDDAVLNGGQRSLREQRLPLPGGEQHVLRDTFALPDEAGGSHAVCSVFSDLALADARLAHCEQQLDAERATRREAERINAARDEFLGLVSHDLRTPLNAMVGWLHVLESGRDFGAQVTERATVGLGRAVRQQRDLVDTLLETARALRGDLTLARERLDLDEMAAAAVEARRQATPALRADLQRAGGPCPVDGDEKRLRYVLDELLAHAARFADMGVLQVRLSRERIGNQEHVLTRIGFDDPAADVAWEPFREAQDVADPGQGKRRRGLAIGLVLAQRLIELSGGQLQVDDDVPSGLQLRLELAQAADTPVVEPPAAAQAVPDTAAALAGLRVLIVDDQPDMRDVLATVLRQAGASVEVAASADEAARLHQELAAAGRIDLGILDVAMPIEDGIALVQRIRRHEQAQGLARSPMIALTAHASPAMREQALAAGFDHFLAKPVLPGELYATIARCVAGRRA